MQRPKPNKLRYQRKSNHVPLAQKSGGQNLVISFIMLSATGVRMATTNAWLLGLEKAQTVTPSVVWHPDDGLPALSETGGSFLDIAGVALGHKPCAMAYTDFADDDSVRCVRRIVSWSDMRATFKDHVLRVFGNVIFRAGRENDAALLTALYHRQELINAFFEERSERDINNIKDMARAWMIGACLGYDDADIGAWLVGYVVLVPWLGNIYQPSIRATLSSGSALGRVARFVARDFVTRRWLPNIPKFKAVRRRLMATPAIQALVREAKHDSRNVF